MLTPPTRPSIAVVTCTRYAALANEDRLLMEALRRLGIEAAHAAWDDPSVNWPSFDLAVVRSVWDYPARLADFHAWARRPRRLLNPLAVLEWNTDKRYLGDLAAAGVPVIPTRFLGPGDLFEVPEPPFVVKPAVSNGAQDSAWYQAGDEAAARAHMRRLQADGRVALVQPYLPPVAAEGEAALVFLGGRYSHAIRRAASLRQPGQPPDAAVPPTGVRAYEPTPAELVLAEAALACAPGGPEGLLFGRVDVVKGPGGTPMVLEVELTAPALFLDFREGAVERLAEAVAEAIGFG